MAQVSRRHLSPKAQQRIFELFLRSFVLCSDKSQAACFIEDLLTPTEKVMLSKRFSIAFMLLNGYDYTTIKNTLKVSSATVGTISVWLKEKGRGYRQIISKIKKDEKLQKIWQDNIDAVEDYLATVPGRDWSASQKRLWQKRREREKPF